MASFAVETGYLLNHFKTSDLQELLGHFGLSTYGQHSELRDRAISVLKRKPPGFEFPAYLAKISDISRRNQITSMMPRNIQQCRPIRPSLPPNPRSSFQIPRDGLFQGSPRIQYGTIRVTSRGMNNIINESLASRGMANVITNKSLASHGMNNINGTIRLTSRGMNNIINESLTSHSNVVVRAPTNYQQYLTVTNPVVINNSPNNNMNSRNSFSSAPSSAYFTFKRLPIYTIKEQIMTSTTLRGDFKCTFSSALPGLKEMELKFNLTAEQATEIAMNRDISDNKNEYLFQLQIRFGIFSPGVTEMIDNLPVALHIRVNKHFCPLPPIVGKTIPAHQVKRKPMPIDCTRLVKLNPNMKNTVHVNWCPDGNKTYIMAMYLVRKWSPEILLQTIIDKGPRSSEEMKNDIKKKLTNADDELSTTSYRVSLICPIGKVRIKLPAKTTKCDHLQCFDAETFIFINQKKLNWTCPSCDKPCFHEDIQIESYFLDIVSNTDLPDNCNEVELFPDGTWKLYEEKKKPTDIAVDVEEKPVESENLDEGVNTTPMKMIQEIVDLTESDGDEPRIDGKE